MPRRRAYSSDSDYSESDYSIAPGPRPTPRRTAAVRSISRHRVSPDYNDHYLSPAFQDVRVHRSASTGGRRRRRSSDAHEGGPRSPAVVVDIKNDSRNRNKSTNRNRNRRFSKTHNEMNLSSEEESDGDSSVRLHRRPRATSNDRGRDYDLLVDQRILEKNDQRQDLELMRQQQEIERLERELSRRRREHDSRFLREEEEEWFEGEIGERLRKLERLERRESRDEELRQRRRSEQRWRMRQLEEEAERERVREEIRDEEVRRKAKEEERLLEEARMKQVAVEEWKLAEERRIIGEREAKEKKDLEFRERLKREFGYTEEEIEAKLKRDKKEKETSLTKVTEYEKTTWIKVHRKHLLPETLMAYRLSWDWDDRDSNYIIIKQWISEDFQEELFAHTRRIREGKLVTETSNTLTELKINDRNKDKMFLVRKKSPSRRAWIFS